MSEQSDSEQIHNLLTRLAHLADDGDLDEYLAEFTVDAVWEMSANPVLGMPADRRVGHAEMATRWQRHQEEGVQGPDVDTRHIVLCTEITSLTDTVATSLSNWIYVIDTRTQPRIASTGMYRDTFRRVDGKWLLAERKLSAG